MKASGARARCSMRVLSPRIEPPPKGEEGSTAKTAKLRPSLQQMQAESLDKGRLADARHAGDADTQ